MSTKYNLGGAEGSSDYKCFKIYGESSRLVAAYLPIVIAKVMFSPLSKRDVCEAEQSV